MKYARIENDTVVDVFITQQGFSIEESLHPNLLGLYQTIVSDEVESGWRKTSDGSFIAPIPPAIPVTVVGTVAT